MGPQPPPAAKERTFQENSLRTAMNISSQKIRVHSSNSRHFAAYFLNSHVKAKARHASGPFKKLEASG